MLEKQQWRFWLTVFFRASISQLRDWICLLDSLASCLACLRESVLRFADSVRSANYRDKRRQHEVILCFFEERQCVIVLIGPPWTCTTPQIPACSSGRWSRIEPWCPSEHQWGLVWTHRPPPSSADASGQSPGHPEFPGSSKIGTSRKSVKCFFQLLLWAG